MVWGRDLSSEWFGLALEVRHDYGTSPQNSQINWRQAPQGGVRVSVSVTTEMASKPLAFADSFEDGDAFGTNGETVSGVLNVASAKNSSGSGAKRGAHAKIRVRRMRVFLACWQQKQRIVFALRSPPQISE